MAHKGDSAVVTNTVVTQEDGQPFPLTVGSTQLTVKNGGIGTLAVSLPVKPSANVTVRATVIDGSNQLAPVLAAPASAPGTATATTGGTVAAGTYQAVVTYVNASGETVGSASASQVTTGATSTLTVNSPASFGNATGWYAYVTQAGGSTYTRQQAAGSPTAIGSNLTLTAPPTSTGAQPPSASTALSSTLTFTSGNFSTPQNVVFQSVAAQGGWQRVLVSASGTDTPGYQPVTVHVLVS